MTAESSPEVLTLGECLVALVASETGPLAETSAFESHVAGAEANVAVGLARLGHRVAYIGRVGGDGFGTAITRRLRGEGVNVDHLMVDRTAPTGILVRERRSIGAAEVLYYRRGSAGSGVTPADVDAAAAAKRFEKARWLHLTGITPALSTTARAALDRAIDVARSAGLTISLDLNLRRRLWTEDEAGPVLRELAGKVDVVMGGADEVRVMLGVRSIPDERSREPLLGRILALGPTTAVVTLGPEGAVAARKGESEVRRPAHDVPSVVDPIGAGDAFAAGLIAGLLEEQSLERAVDMGIVCAASVLSSVGDMTGLPDRRELDELLATDRDPARDTHR